MGVKATFILDEKIMEQTREYVSKKWFLFHKKIIRLLPDFTTRRTLPIVESFFY